MSNRAIFGSIQSRNLSGSLVVTTEDMLHASMRWLHFGESAIVLGEMFAVHSVYCSLQLGATLSDQ
jgi:hypothetical protein